MEAGVCLWSENLCAVTWNGLLLARGQKSTPWIEGGSRGGDRDRCRGVGCAAGTMADEWLYGAATTIVWLNHCVKAKVPGLLTSIL